MRARQAVTRKRVFQTLMLVLCLAGTGHAGDTYWQAGTGDWDEPANWAGSVPAASETAYIDNGGTARITRTIPAVGGLIVRGSAGLTVVWGWQLRRAAGTQEQSLARRVALISGVGMIADWVSGYYGFGSLMALLTGLWLMRKHPR